MRTALSSLGCHFDDVGPGTVVVTPAAVRASAQPVDCGLAGTVMRFVPPMAALADGPTTFVGDPAAQVRPVAPLLQGLRQLGVGVDADRLPFTVTPPASLGGPAVRVDASSSSQFVTALLLSGARFPRGLRLEQTGHRVPSRPHIAMTVAMLRARGVEVHEQTNTWTVAPGPISALDQRIEPDLTSAAVFLAAAALTGGSVTVPSWPADSTQPGALILELLSRMGARVTRRDGNITVSGGDTLTAVDVDLQQASELTPVLAALAVFAEGISRISGVEHIRGHETDRLAALANELTAVGVNVIEHADGLTIHGVGLAATGLHGRVMRSYADHRLAHVAALIGLLVPGIVSDDIACTSKTIDHFADRWNQMVQATPPGRAPRARGEGR